MLQVSAETPYTAIPIDRWHWFFRNAAELTTERISQLLLDQEFSEAATVREMNTQTPEQLYEYNACVKAQRDAEARIIFAKQQGIEIGEARGIRRGLLQGQILLIQQLPNCQSALTISLLHLTSTTSPGCSHSCYRNSKITTAAVHSLEELKQMIAKPVAVNKHHHG